jgi:hypothetical protein
MSKCFLVFLFDPGDWCISGIVAECFFVEYNSFIIKHLTHQCSVLIFWPLPKRPLSAEYRFLFERFAVSAKRRFQEKFGWPKDQVG